MSRRKVLAGQGPSWRLGDRIFSFSSFWFSKSTVGLLRLVDTPFLFCLCSHLAFSVFLFLAFSLILCLTTTLTKYHRLCRLNNKYLLLMALETESLRSQCQHVGFWWWPSSRLLTDKLRCSHGIKGQERSLKIPLKGCLFYLWLHFFPSAPSPNTITLVLGVQEGNFGGTQMLSIQPIKVIVSEEGGLERSNWIEMKS